jgi:beta-mannosidase
MNKINLSGVWGLCDKKKRIMIKGQLPGCNYLDLMKEGIIEDPFWAENEKELTKIAESEYEYFREFQISSEQLKENRIDLVISGLDTLASIQVNGKEVSKTNNVHRTYRFNLKELVVEGINKINITFPSPLPYIEEKNTEDKIPFSMGMGIDGISHLRKVQCHFGWDWGPVLPPVGITGHIELQCYSVARIDQVIVEQKHDKGQVSLEIETILAEVSSEGNNPTAEIIITSPMGDKIVTDCLISKGYGKTVITLLNPMLWWSNGLGEQYLYQVEVILKDQELLLDQWNKRIGLRTIELDTAKDQWGSNFRFIINGVPIFAKGADWIPSDSFVTRTSHADLEFYIKSAYDSNMNMLRVWGGGYYESDDFYELCDTYGILVWQDFCFACAPYPFYDKEFLANVEGEVQDNIRRLRHHASLALWSGNNEIEMVAGMWKKNKRLFDANQSFFHDILPEWVKREDKLTPYWPGSPNSGTKDLNPNDLNIGDTHLWQIWHGMRPIEYFRKLPTRFCSEFGMESMPSLKAIRSFTDQVEPSIFDPVMLSHQKSKGGNQKMLFYLLAKYRNPVKLEDFIYLSQLVQAETVREATEEWKRNLGRCNGAIYWQYNDCWPVASWAGIDYLKQYKAVMYKARQFNSLLSASADVFKDRVDIYAINEYPQIRSITVLCKLEDFEGNQLWENKYKLPLEANTAKKVMEISFSEGLKGQKKDNVVLILQIFEEEKLMFSQTRLIVPDKKTKLSSPKITKKITIDGSKGRLTLSTNQFARYVYVDIEGVDTPLSDNYFDLRKDNSVTITFDLPHNIRPDELENRINIKTLADISFKGNKLDDIWQRVRMRLHKDNFIAWIVFKFI